jgi:hypothetical protein
MKQDISTWRVHDLRMVERELARQCPGLCSVMAGMVLTTAKQWVSPSEGPEKLLAVARAQAVRGR